jgi:hypothetical protein
MMDAGLKLCLQNATGRLRTVRLEPWARHFLLTPDEKLEITAGAGSGPPRLRVVEAGETTLIYTEECDQVRVIQDGITHDLLPVYDAAPPAARPEPRSDDPMWDRDLDFLA